MSEFKEAISSWSRRAAKNAGWLVALGVVTVIAGVLAVGSPLSAGLAVSVLLGVALLIAGITRTMAAFSAGSFGQGALAFVGGIVSFVAGAT